MRAEPWKIIGFPFGFLAIVLMLVAHQTGNSQWALWAIAPFLLLAIAFVLSPQINWWWWQRSPPTLDPRTERLLDDYFFYYKKLSPELKLRFRSRVALFLRAHEFMRPVDKNQMDAEANRSRVPEDLKAAVAAAAAQVFFGKPQLTAGKYENIIIYPHRFPTPQYPTFHASEIFDEDGVMLFDADTLMSGFSQPQRVFSVGLYEYVRIFRKTNPSVVAPIFEENTFERLEKISGMTRATISSVVGLENLDDFGIVAHHFFNFGERFQTVLPDLYQLLVNIFQQNPADGANPIVKW